MRILSSLLFLGLLAGCDLGSEFPESTSESGEMDDESGTGEDDDEEMNEALSEDEDTLSEVSESDDTEVSESESKTVGVTQEESSGDDPTPADPTAEDPTPDDPTPDDPTPDDPTPDPTMDETVNPAICYNQCIFDARNAHAETSAACREIDKNDCNFDICIHENAGNYERAQIECWDECEYEEGQGGAEIEEAKCMSECRLDFAECGHATTCDHGSMSTCYQIFVWCTADC